MACTYYRDQIGNFDQIIECFIEGMHSMNSAWIDLSMQAFILSFVNLRDQIQIHLSDIILSLSKSFQFDTSISKNILEFLMRKIKFKFSYFYKHRFLDLLFDNFNDQSLIVPIFGILIDIINQYQQQTAHNLILAHTLLCFYFNQLSANQRQIYSYFLIRV